jgi:hypothetical protein
VLVTLVQPWSRERPEITYAAHILQATLVKKLRELWILL